MHPIKTITSPYGRIYLNKDGMWYPSVTTFLGATSDKTGLEEWRSRIGNEEADRICKKASDYGELYHNGCEQLLLKGEYDLDVPILVEKALKRVTPVIKSKVDRVICTERAFFSPKMMLAGRVDGIVYWEGEPAIIDHKLVKMIYDPKRGFYNDYLLQGAAYAIMAYENNCIAARKIVILLNSKMTNELLPLVGDLQDVSSMLNERLRKWRLIQGKIIAKCLQWRDENICDGNPGEPTC